MPQRRALIDGDILVYKAAFAAEFSVYLDWEEGQYYKKREYAPENVRKSLQWVSVANDPQIAVDALKSMIRATVVNTNATHITIFLSPDETFRDKIAVSHPYKGNREGRSRPAHYDLVRNILINDFGASICDNIEADDALGIMQTMCKSRNESSVICSIDKDLLMIPGDHYNLTSHKNSIVSKTAGQQQYAMQLLMGDSTDNIVGIKGIGPKTAEKLLKGLEPKDFLSLIKSKYKDEFGDDWEKRFKENAILLKILTKPLKRYSSMYMDITMTVTSIEILLEGTESAGNGFEATR